MHFLISTSSTSFESLCSGPPLCDCLIELLVFFIPTQSDSLTPLLTFTRPSCLLLEAAAGARLPGRAQQRLDVRPLKGLLKCVESLNAVHSERTAMLNRAGRQVRQGGIVRSGLQVGFLRVGSTDLCSDGPGTLSKNITRARREAGTARTKSLEGMVTTVRSLF